MVIKPSTNSVHPLIFAQLNCQHHIACIATLDHFLYQHKIDIALLQEPYVAGAAIRGISTDYNIVSTDPSVVAPKACILLRKCYPFQVISSVQSANLVCVKVSVGSRSLFIFSAYCPPSMPLVDILQPLQQVLTSLPAGAFVIIGIDSNARSIAWGDVRTSLRGQEMEDFIQTSQLVLMNDGSGPTFSSTNGESFIDLTLVSGPSAPFCTDWQVSEREFLSDHRLISFRFYPCNSVPIINAPLRHNLKRANWSLFTSLLHDNLPQVPHDMFDTPQFIDDCAAFLTDTVQRAADQAIPRCNPARRYVRWWSPELTALKALTRRAAHHYRSCSDPYVRPLLYQIYRGHLRAFRQEIRRAKFASWRLFCEEAQAQPWRPFQVLSRQSSSSPMYFTVTDPSTSVPDMIEHTVDSLFPLDDPSTDSPQHAAIRCQVASYLSNDESCVASSQPFFSASEVKTAVFSMNGTKAPGHDGIQLVLLQKGIGALLPILTFLFNSCLAAKYFPTTWKRGTLTLLRKPGATVPPPKCYRPIILLPTMGKVLERLLLNRLHAQSQQFNWFHSQQYGFRPHMSSEQAVCTLVKQIEAAFGAQRLAAALFLDISGAYDNASHPIILNFLISRGCPREFVHLIASYLSDRSVYFTYGGHSYTRYLNKSCPQGGVLSPFLWNCLLDSILRALFPSSVKIQAYADDIVVFCDASKVSSLERRLSKSLSILHSWSITRKLTFNAAKTKLVVFTRSHIAPQLELSLSNQPIEQVSVFKYLGTFLDRKLLFNHHLEHIYSKAIKRIFLLQRCASVSWGLSSRAVDVLYRMVIVPTVLYAAPAWASLSLKRTAQIKLRRITRLAALLRHRAYHTSSTAALEVLAGYVPLPLCIQERALIYFYKYDFIHPKLRHLLLSSGLHMFPRPTDLAAVHTRPPSIFTFDISFDPNLVYTFMSGANDASALFIFTDGSKSPLGAGSAAAIYRSFDTNTVPFYLSSRLALYSTVFQCEVYALYLAANWLFHRAISAMHIHFFIDNQALLRILEDQTNRHNHSQELTALFWILFELSTLNQLSFHWVPAHQGIPGNEFADKIAKQVAINTNLSTVFLPPALSYVRQYLANHSNILWNSEWRAGSTARLTFQFLPVIPLKSPVFKIHLPLFFHLLSGHGNFGAYKQRFHLGDSPACICGALTEDSQHVIFSCPRYAVQRHYFYAMLTSESLPSPPPISHLLDHKILPHFINYLQSLHRTLYFHPQ